VSGNTRFDFAQTLVEELKNAAEAFNQAEAVWLLKEVIEQFDRMGDVRLALLTLRKVLPQLRSLREERSDTKLLYLEQRLDLVHKSLN
jgi:hypothetical protein